MFQELRRRRTYIVAIFMILTLVRASFISSLIFVCLAYLKLLSRDNDVVLFSLVAMLDVKSVLVWQKIQF